MTTGTKVLTLTPSLSNQYSKNRATFNPTDELVLSDGVLWDVSSGKQIHKFDKLNQMLSGVFHPNGLEVSTVYNILYNYKESMRVLLYFNYISLFILNIFNCYYSRLWV